MNIRNSDGLELKKVLKDNNVSTYRGTCVKDFPNLVSSTSELRRRNRSLTLSLRQFWLMGPNT